MSPRCNHPHPTSAPSGEFKPWISLVPSSLLRIHKHVLCICFSMFISIGPGMCPAPWKCTWPFMPMHGFYSLRQRALVYTLVLGDMTLDNRVSQYSALFSFKKEIPAHKWHANGLRSPPTYFLNSVQNFKYLIPRHTHFCQRILSVEMKHRIPSITWKDWMLRWCSPVMKNESREDENVPRNCFSITTLELTTTTKARDHDNHSSRKSIQLLRT